MPRRLLAIAAAATLASGPALAHHPMGGGVPGTFVQGLLSGLGHPIIGVDHLAAVLAAGLIAGAVGASALLPLAFVLASLAGVGLHLALVTLPAAEALAALSVVALGALLLGRRLPGAAALVALFAAAGALHGYAYGESIVGAEASPLLAYLVGLALVQAGIATASLVLARLAAGAGEGRTVRAYRLGGLAVLAVGVGALALSLGA